MSLELKWFFVREFVRKLSEGIAYKPSDPEGLTYEEDGKKFQVYATI